jgi:hypothetical protein
LILGAGLVLLRKRRGMGALALAAFAGGMLAMGPVLVRDGQAWIFSGGLAVPMPYFLVEDLPGFESLSLLFRLGILPILVLAVIAGGLASQLKERWWVFLVLVVVDLRFLSPVAALPAVESASLSPVLSRLAEAPPGAVMNYPIVGGRPYLYEQTAHEKPIAGRLNFPNNHASKKVWNALQVAQEMPVEAGRRHLRAIAQKSRTGACEEIRAQCAYGNVRHAGASDLCRCIDGVRYLVIHEDSLARPDMHQGSVDWAEVSLPVLAMDEKQKVIQLW